MSRRSNPEYSGEHSAPDSESGAPLWDVTQNGIYPKDVYQIGYQYIDNSDPYERQALSLVDSYYRKPNRVITVYRSIPKSVKGGINEGDWVTIIRKYATDHGHAALRGDFKISQKMVHARDLFTEGNSLFEWGYFPQEYDRKSDDEKLIRQAIKRGDMETAESLIRRFVRVYEVEPDLKGRNG